MDEIKKFEPLWGSWYVTECIGEGSFGKVYKIERKEFGNTYTAALKYIRVPQSQSEIKSIMADGMTSESVETYFESVVEDIVGEFVLMSKLKGNSHVVSYEDHKVIKDETSIGWDIFIRMELLTSLLDYIHDNNISKRDVIKLGIDMCKALELCQKYNIIHRDIKPENIFVSESGDYKLGDFGIARQVEKTVAGLSKKGTFTYIAPEVYKGEAYGSTVDIYSLGIVMYRLLNNNRVPFMPPYPAVISHADREMALVKRMSGKPVEKPINADGRLAEIVLKACAFNPADRYNSPLLMRMELEAILYDAAEKKVIYPHGDKAEQQSVKYVKTEEDYTATLQNTQYKIENNETLLMTDVSEKIKIQKKEDELSQKAVINNEVPAKSEKERCKNRIIMGIGAAAVILICIFVLVSMDKKEKTEPVTADAEASEAETTNSEENAAAVSIFEDLADTNEIYKYYPYCLYDINNDGITELIIGNDGSTGGSVDIYGCQNDEAVLLGNIETYGNAFELGYIYEYNDGLGLVMKTEYQTEYGYWSFENNSSLQYHMLSRLVNTDGKTAYYIEGVSTDQETYEAFIREIAQNKITSYVVPRETTTETTTEETTETAAEAPTQTQNPASNSSNSYSSGSSYSGSSGSSYSDSSGSSSYSAETTDSSNADNSGGSSNNSESSGSSGSSDSGSGDDMAAPELFIGF